MKNNRIRKILFLRPPRHYWPILNEADNFLLPLAYPSISAYVKREIPEIEFTILDCCAHRMGWTSLRKYINEGNFNMVCIGEKVCFCNESNRAFKLIKEINPTITTVAGGQFYSHVVEDSLRNNKCIDYIIRFEGEIPLTHLINTLNKNENIFNVPNLAFIRANTLHLNPIAELIDMTNLPIPSYENSFLDKYQAFGKLWPKAVTIQRSRGCTNNCSYCSWISQESYISEENNKLTRKSTFRSKTVSQVLNEIDLLYNKYNIRYLFWVDASWNYDNGWLNEFCDELLKRKYNLGWWAFIRLDLIPEQHTSGLLEKMVKVGLRHILSGADRPEADGLKTLSKLNQNYSKVKEAIYIFKKYYPQVFRQCTFITGLPEDKAEDIRAVLDYAHDIDVDFAAFHTITPFPGTPLYEEAKKSGLLMDSDYTNYDMFYPVMRTKYLSQQEVAYWTIWCQSNFVQKKPFRYFSRFFSPYPIRRKLHWWFAYSITKVMITQLWNHARGIERFKGFAGVNKLWKPKWYDH
ncbi:MAG: hypothetical protein ACD_79C00311G0002 [uncultured bacterium]|nr:MAG: hypothetical protein ACD_79C00311G0002 [uncultured bacterium]